MLLALVGAAFLLGACTHVVVPDVAAAGEYLLCTANAVDRACALLTVTD